MSRLRLSVLCAGWLGQETGHSSNNKTGYSNNNETGYRNSG